MATYRLKSKLYGEFDGEKKDKGILNTGITAGQALMVGATALAGRGIYRNMAFKGKIGGVGSQAHMAEVQRRAGKLKPGAHSADALAVRQQQRNILNNARNGGQSAFEQQVTAAGKQYDMNQFKQGLQDQKAKADILRNSGLYGSKSAANKFEKNALNGLISPNT